MKFGWYLRDRWYLGVLLGVVMVLTAGILGAFGTGVDVILAIEVTMVLGVVLGILVDFWRKKRFYGDLLGKIRQLDQGYLVLETMREPNFYEGELVFETLGEINKSMTEGVRDEREKVQNFKDYVEMWIHEVKRPLASLGLVVENLWKSRGETGLDRAEDDDERKIKAGNGGAGRKREKVTEEGISADLAVKNDGMPDREARERILGNLRELERDVEQVLYFVRGENAEEDYLIRKTSLTEVVRKVGMRNMEDFLANEVEFEVGEVDFRVETDGKWLEFILNQIVNNSIKYRRRTGAKVAVRAWKEGKRVILEVSDNGVGISAGDLPRVFEKSFTGENGRKREASTGMGLYIAKNLCEKLGHKIEIESEEGKGTKVRIVFGEDEFLEVVG